MPMPTWMHSQAVKSAVVFVSFVAGVDAQVDVTDAQLDAASAGRVVRLGPAAGTGPVVTLPLEVYVARVLAGEGEPRAAEAAHRALAVAIRTFALANGGRHARDGFDLCDSTHCQVPRTATPATRRAVLATAGQLLTYEGSPAELFYSASCGGYSETAAQVWPGADYPYLQAAPDDVHGEDLPWTLELTLQQVERALERVGFEGRLRDVRVDERSASGRAARLQLPGLFPDVIAGDQFRAAIGTTTLRSTAFSVEARGANLRFTGRGYGHGVGMCVIGAGRRAARGETVEAILAQYYPGLRLTGLDGTAGRTAGGLPPLLISPAGVGSLGDPTSQRWPDGPLPRTVPAGRRPARGGIVVRMPEGSTLTAAEVEELTVRVHDRLAKMLGVAVAPITVRVHASLESFRLATGRPWWVSSVSEGTSIDLVPTAVLDQRDGFEAALRTAVAELLVAEPLGGRPLWVRIGAARYFGLDRPGTGAETRSAARCPSDAELTLAISAPAQRDAEARAEQCFAREYARTRDWRAVR